MRKTRKLRPLVSRSTQTNVRSLIVHRERNKETGEKKDDETARQAYWETPLASNRMRDVDQALRAREGSGGQPFQGR